MAGVAGITFYCVNSAALYFFYDSCVVGIAVKSVGCPIEENNHSFLWLLCTVEPFSFVLKPINTGIAYGVFRDKVVFYISALFCTQTLSMMFSAPFRGGCLFSTFLSYTFLYFTLLYFTLRPEKPEYPRKPRFRFCNSVAVLFSGRIFSVIVVSVESIKRF